MARVELPVGEMIVGHDGRENVQDSADDAEEEVLETTKQELVTFILKYLIILFVLYILLRVIVKCSL